MYCEKCGTKCENGAKFCGKCGHKLLEVKIKEVKKNNIYNRYKIKLNELSKKNKIIMGIVLIIVIIALIILSILLNNPIKKIEDGLEKYYNKYNEVNNNHALKDIGKVLKSNKNNSEVLNNIKKTTKKQITKWVKNFNTNYKNIEEIKKAYDKTNGAINDLYNTYSGLININEYNELKNELDTIYYSKQAYINGLENETKKENYYAYYYYQKVNKEDSYYNKASKFINTYLSEENKKLQEEANKFIKLDGASNKDILECYIKQLEYIEKNKKKNNIDLSITEDYKKIYNESTKKIFEYTNLLLEEVNEKEYEEKIKILEYSMDKIKDIENDSYKKLKELKKKYENMKPINLIELNTESYSNGTSYSIFSKSINNIEYKNYISFKFKDKQYRTYNLNKEYKNFLAEIVMDNKTDKNLKGYIVIYGNDKELYKSEILNVNEKFNSKININVTNIKDLRIEFVSLTKTDKDDNIYLVMPYLYR